MYYIGIDLAWSDNNPSGVGVLKNDEVLYCDTLTTLEEIIQFISQYPNAKVGIDSPLKVENKDGNRTVEKEFLKDYSSKKLGIYPANRKLLENKNGLIRGEELIKMIPQKLGNNLFEVYPHATILECFHGEVLPYKRKKGRDTQYIRSQLLILQNYLQSALQGEFIKDIQSLKGKSLKEHEDKLDALVCAYTLYYCENNPYTLYEDIFMVPKRKAL